MLPVINEISSQQANPMQATNDEVSMLIDYAHSHHDTVIRYHASNMQLHIDSDAAYLVLPKVCSQGAGYFYLSNEIENTHSIPAPTPNGPILIKCVNLRNVMLSVAEAEVGTVHYDGKVAILIIAAFNEMGRIQSPVSLKIDNLTAKDFLNSNIRQKLSKSFDVRLN